MASQALYTAEHPDREANIASQPRREQARDTPRLVCEGCRWFIGRYDDEKRGGKRRPGRRQHICGHALKMRAKGWAVTCLSMRQDNALGCGREAVLYQPSLRSGGR